jgi:5-methyltetrahydropteroyltriglutamate--homocysteine methyltransferase
VAGSKVPLELLELLGEKVVLAGAIDVASEKVETPEEVAATIRAVLEHAPADRVHPCTNCGMVPLARGLARAKMSALAAGTAIVRLELGEDV